MASTEQSIWESIKYLLGAGGIVTLLIAFMKYIQALGDKSRIVDEAHILRLEKEIENLKKEKELLEDKAVHLRLIANISTQRYSDYKKPLWAKDHNQKFVFGNDAFEQYFQKPQGKTVRDYRGLTDIEFHGNELGKEYQKKSEYVYRTGETTVTVDRAIINGQESFWLVERQRTESNGIPNGTIERVIMQVKDEKGNPI